MRDPRETLQIEPREREPRPSLELVALLDEAGKRFELPMSGVVVIGRDDHADVAIRNQSISRRHVALHIGRTLQLEDIGSSNGTFVSGRRLERGDRIDIQPGDFFELGDVACVIKGGAHTERLRRLRSHAYFEARLEDEVARAERASSRFSVARIHADGEVAGMLLEALRPGDVAARYAGAEFELLLVETTPEVADRIVRELAARLRTLNIAVRAGVAHFPRDGRSPDALLGRANAASLPPRRPTETNSQIIVEDDKMKRLHTLIERVARGHLNVMLLGETGVGKEVFAERLHAASPRHKKPLVRLNCAAFTETLLESELFGHEKGSFTGADGHKTGLLESADGGVVFLDEIGELPPTIQAKLLRVLEEGKVRRVGGLKSRAIDVQFVSATNRNLDKEIAAGRFRSDLYFRLNGVSVAIPPLRERPGDIMPLAQRFAESAARRLGVPTPSFTDDAISLLQRYRWPGNVRELRNAIERAVLLSGGETLTREDFSIDDVQVHAASELAGAIAEVSSAGCAPAGLSAEEREERDRIIRALAQALGNQTRAAEVLGISRRWLATKMDRYNIPRRSRRV